MNFTLILTSSIEPSQFSGKIKRNDVNQRLNDYIDSLKKWLLLDEKRITHIIFADNSSHSLEKLELLVEKYNVYNRKIEFIKTEETIVPNGIHYGYSELEIIDDCYIKSKLIKQNEYIIKCTGRIFIRNISKTLNDFNHQSDIMIDSRLFNLFGYNHEYCVTNFFIVKRDFYFTELFNIKDKMIENKVSHFELIYFKHLYQLYKLKTFQIQMRLKAEIQIEGYGAHWNKNYQGYVYKTQSLIRNIARKIIPRLWI